MMTKPEDIWKTNLENQWLVWYFGWLST